jgi:hypothetical protein
MMRNAARLLLLLGCTLASTHTGCTGSSVNLAAEECSAFGEFYDALNGPRWRTATAYFPNDCKTDPCSCTASHEGTSFGIGCNEEHTSVTQMCVPRRAARATTTCSPSTPGRLTCSSLPPCCTVALAAATRRARSQPPSATSPIWRCLLWTAVMSAARCRRPWRGSRSWLCSAWSSWRYHWHRCPGCRSRTSLKSKGPTQSTSAPFSIMCREAATPSRVPGRTGRRVCAPNA